ncbi:flagellar protein FlgN [Halobacteriovorax sp. GB3]|uniref:flagellar protein FlgN n=1 Tax=Halobacteriovorax sp. GB3 TaxID=2719615 RepID=UPI002360108E|nr:flagellar protein FlgN [Halobacteriovorax sp. GB3]MDD0854819.1 flagellar protein FlgN [Halobacteriovorax sp. GB3]
MEKTSQLQLLYFRITDLWKEFCELHNQLFEYTCDEYSHLLASELEDLEETINKKKKVIEKIGFLEKQRLHLITDLNKILDNKQVNTVSELTQFFHDFETEKEQKHLFRFNALLVDIIQKIQDQNKRNQVFINKAIHSLKEIREDAIGQKSYATYNSFGKAKAKSLNI